LLLAVNDGLILGDLGYRGKDFQDLILDETGILLLTRADTPDHKQLLSQVRQQMETTFSQLWDQFIDRVVSRSWRGWWNPLRLKVLFYNLCHAGAISL